MAAIRILESPTKSRREERWLILYIWDRLPGRFVGSEFEGHTLGFNSESGDWTSLLQFTTVLLHFGLLEY